MQSNESFRLLNLSGDSLSDLELDDSVNLNQRKRKTRRKTRSRSGALKSPSVLPKPTFKCKNIGLWVTVGLTCSWLFILSYILAVIQVEYRRLEIELQKVSATTQHVPEALQKWHETSKYLEQNQTNISQTLASLQESMKAFSNEMTLMQQSVEHKNDFSQESQFKGLQENLAKLGSKIEDFSGRIEKLEHEYELLRNGQESINVTVMGLDTKVKNAAPTVTLSDNTTRQHLEDVSKQLQAQIQSLSSNVGAEQSELKAKIGFLKNDFAEQKNKTDSLLDQTMNISSHVSSIENLYTTKLSTQLIDLEGRTNNLTISLNQAQTQCAYNVKQYDELAHEIQELRKKFLIQPSSDVVAVPAVAASEAKMFPLPVHSTSEPIQSSSSSLSSSSNKSVISQNNTISNTSNNNNNKSDSIASNNNNNNSDRMPAGNVNGKDTVITM